MSSSVIIRFLRSRMDSGNSTEDSLAKWADESAEVEAISCKAAAGGAAEGRRTVNEPLQKYYHCWVTERGRHRSPGWLYLSLRRPDLTWLGLIRNLCGVAVLCGCRRLRYTSFLEGIAGARVRHQQQPPWSTTEHHGAPRSTTEHHGPPTRRWRWRGGGGGGGREE